jgi:hypothetical protein
MNKKFFCCTTIFISLFFTAKAYAVSTTAASAFYFDSSNNLIGQSLRYCANDKQHIGTASSSNRNKVTIFYNCDSGAVSVTYDVGVPGVLRNDFCALYQVCDDPMPWPINAEFLNYPIEQGFYSN